MAGAPNSTRPRPARRTTVVPGRRQPLGDEVEQGDRVAVQADPEQADPDQDAEHNGAAAELLGSGVERRALLAGELADWIVSSRPR